MKMKMESKVIFIIITRYNIKQFYIDSNKHKTQRNKSLEMRIGLVISMKREGGWWEGVGCRQKE